MALTQEQLNSARNIISNVKTKIRQDSSPREEFYQRVRPEPEPEKKGVGIGDVGKAIWDITSYPARKLIGGVKDFGSKIAENKESLYEDFGRLARGEINPVSYGFKTAKNLIAEPAQDLAGDYIAEGAKTLFEKLPEEAQQGIVDTAQNILQSSVGQGALEAMQAGGEIWDGFKQDHPRIAEDIESLASIGFFMADVAGGINLTRKAGTKVASKLDDAVTGLAKTGTKMKKTAVKAGQGFGQMSDDLVSGTKRLTKKATDKIKNLKPNIPGVNKSLNKVDDIADYIKPIRNKREWKDAIGKGGKAIQSKRLTKQLDVATSNWDKQVAKAIQEYIVDTNVGDNITRLRNGIEHISENIIEPVLKRNPKPINLLKFRTSIAPTTGSITIKGTDKGKLIRAVLDEAVDQARKAKTTDKLWDIKKNIMRMVQDEVPNIFDVGKEKLANKIIKDINKGFNKYIAQQLPEGGKVFKDNMDKLHKMFEGIENLKGKAWLQRQMSGLDDISRTAADLPIVGPIMGKTKILRKR